MIKYLDKLNIDFETNYLEVRDIENRIFTDEIVLQLPNLKLPNPYYNEWLLRKETSDRFLNYLNKFNPKSVLEIGCGNGWFCNQMKKTNSKMKVNGLDINETELIQADRLFPEVNFYYGETSSLVEKNHKYDLIVFNASIQYFEDLTALFSLVKKMLTENGEIHILDSPFYKENELKNAKKRTQDYYQKMNCAQMTKFYFHLSFSQLGDYKFLYRPSKLGSYLGKGKSIFPWIKIL